MHNYDAQQHRAGQIISPLTLQTITIAQMLSVGGEGEVKKEEREQAIYTAPNQYMNHSALLTLNPYRAVCFNDDLLNFHIRHKVQFAASVQGHSITYHPSFSCDDNSP